MDVASPVVGPLVSHPKAGSTWVRYILSAYLNEIFEVGINPLFLVEIRRFIGWVPETPGTQRHDHYLDGRVPRLCATHSRPHEPALQDGKLVFLLRHPLDMVVSQYFHVTRHAPAHADEGLADYALGPFGLSPMADFFNDWAPAVRKREALVLSYEALSADTLGSMKGVLRKFGLPGDEHVLCRAIEASRFEKMWSLETARPLVMSGNIVDITDPEARRARRGKIGGYVDYLSPQAIVQCWAKFRSNLSSEASGLLSDNGISLGAHG